MQPPVNSQSTIMMATCITSNFGRLHTVQVHSMAASEHGWPCRMHAPHSCFKNTIQGLAYHYLRLTTTVLSQHTVTAFVHYDRADHGWCACIIILHCIALHYNIALHCIVFNERSYNNTVPSVPLVDRLAYKIYAK
jgi:hypothetical protein